MTTFWKPESRAAEKKGKSRDIEKLWQRTRQCVLIRDGYKCRACWSRADVDVHHIRFRSVGGNLFDTANTAAICRVCHADIHAYRLHVIGTDANKPLRFERST